MNIGIIGLDTSHVVAFTKLLNDKNHPFHVKGGKVVVAFQGGSPSFELSKSRLEKFTLELKENFNIKIVQSMEEVAEESDAILLESVDGSVHFEELKKIAAFKKPIFIDKPFTLSSEVAAEMEKIAEEFGTPVMSSSALRYAESITKVLQKHDKGGIIGADCFGPLEIIDQQQGYFWYGIHMAEMLFAILGPGVKSVSTISNEHHDILTGYWNDGRLGTIRGNRKGNNQFGALIHFEEGSEYVTINSQDKPFYASLLEQIIHFFHSGITNVPLSETKEIIRFIEAAHESGKVGKPINL
ncbi:MAG: Gfo/Idh/MocA family oxidoreductase [Paenisporosarcina sp.]